MTSKINIYSFIVINVHKIRFEMIKFENKVITVSTSALSVSYTYTMQNHL